MEKMMVSHKILARQICSECCNYLSVGPVMVYQGKKICGRCIKQGYTQKACLSLYDKIAENCIFKCINHYSGCKQVLAYNEAIDHEKTCKKKGLKCPYCKFIGNGCQLIDHFIKIHSESIAEDNVFPILSEPSGPCNFMFVENDCLLCVTISISDEIIHISNLLVGEHDHNSDLKYFKMIFCKPNSSVQYVTPEIQINTDQELYRQQGNHVAKMYVKNCFTWGKCLVKVNLMHNDEESTVKQTKCVKKSVLENKSQLRQDITKVALTFDRTSTMDAAELKRFASMELNKQRLCVNCDRDLYYCKDIIYFCPRYHFACAVCSNKKCRQCDVFCLWNKAKFDHLLSLQYDWEGCDYSVKNILHFLMHKQLCSHRQYQCPDGNCRYVACLEEFKKHWHLTPYENSTAITFQGTCAFYCFITFCNEFVYVTVEKGPKMITINVNEETVLFRNSYTLNITYSIHIEGRGIFSYNLGKKWEYSQSRLARTRSATIPSSMVRYYRLEFSKK